MKKLILTLIAVSALGFGCSENRSNNIDPNAPTLTENNASPTPNPSPTPPQLSKNQRITLFLSSIEGHWVGEGTQWYDGDPHGSSFILKNYTLDIMKSAQNTWTATSHYCVEPTDIATGECLDDSVQLWLNGNDLFVIGQGQPNKVSTSSVTTRSLAMKWQDTAIMDASGKFGLNLMLKDKNTLSLRGYHWINGHLSQKETVTLKRQPAQ